jgi:hypothetical protein
MEPNATLYVTADRGSKPLANQQRTRTFSVEHGSVNATGQNITYALCSGGIEVKFHLFNTYTVNGRDRRGWREKGALRTHWGRSCSADEEDNLEAPTGNRTPAVTLLPQATLAITNVATAGVL